MSKKKMMWLAVVADLECSYMEGKEISTTTKLWEKSQILNAAYTYAKRGFVWPCFIVMKARLRTFKVGILTTGSKTGYVYTVTKVECDDDEVDSFAVAHLDNVHYFQ